MEDFPTKEERLSALQLSIKNYDFVALDIKLDYCKHSILISKLDYDTIISETQNIRDIDRSIENKLRESITLICLSMKENESLLHPNLSSINITKNGYLVYKIQINDSQSNGCTYIEIDIFQDEVKKLTSQRIDKARKPFKTIGNFLIIVLSIICLMLLIFMIDMLYHLIFK